MLKDISDRFGNFESALEQVSLCTKAVMEQNSKVMEKLEMIDTDNKTRIEQNAKDIQDIRDNQSRYACDTDSRGR